MKSMMMPHEFTPTAERALTYASHWWRRAPNGTGAHELGPAELLLGLLAEPECRAAVLAAARGVDLQVSASSAGPGRRPANPARALPVQE